MEAAQPEAVRRPLAARGGSRRPGAGPGQGAACGGGGGAAAGGIFLFRALRHPHHQVVGCATPDGKTLTADKDKHAYQLAGAPMTAGEHLSVQGKKVKN